MEDKILVDYGKILRVIINKIWIFVFIMCFFVGSSVIMSDGGDGNDVSYTAKDKLIITQGIGNKTGEWLDNSSRVQAAYDAKEILTSGTFFEGVSEKLDFDISIGELKNSVLIEQIPTTRLLEVTVTRQDPEEVIKILSGIQEYAQEYLQNIMQGVEVKSLEKLDETMAQGRKNSVNGIKIGILKGGAVCIVLSCVFILLYLINNSIRSKEDVERYLGIPVIGEFKKSGYGRGRKNEKK